MKKGDALSTEPYKGVRDFYPEDQFIQRYIFEHMERVCELFGYEEYNASILEPAELYRSKTSEEIVSEQTYTFTDRGDREVTLRPEMTPTFARMIAARQRDIPIPARWYTIANVFRYERPQRGRLREHWQLNADMIGVSGVQADAEILAIAHAILISMGATERDFEIRVSDRRILDDVYEEIGIDETSRARVTRLLDRRGKIDDFEGDLAGVIQDEDKAAALIDRIGRITSSSYLEELRITLEHMGINNMIVDTAITRGFDYYTGMVFEVFDTNPENRRSMFGGGRYDNLLSMFGGDPLPTVGFGMGDVTARDFLESHNLLPTYAPATELMIAIVDESATSLAIRLAQDLRRDDVTVAINFSGRKIGDQIRHADKMRIPFVIAVGSQERESGRYTIKNLATGSEITLPAERITEHLFSALGNMRVVTFDIETANWLQDVGSNDPADLTIAIVCIHDSETDAYSSYLAHELPRLWPILERADVLVGYNSDHFDIPLLNKYYPGDLTRIKSIDIMKEVQSVLGRRLKLDMIAEGTLGQKLDGKNGQSIIWWREGKVDQVREYCIKDVELTRKIFEYALAKGSLKYKELGKTQEVKVDTSQWLAPSGGAMTFTLGL